MKLWMIDFLQKHGFWGVILMSAWPNMAFDLCGICCGHFLMPFWTFFGATLIGKSVIKINLQACFFIMLFTPTHFQNFVNFIDALIPNQWDPCLLFGTSPCHSLLQKVLHEARTNFHKQASGQSAVEESLLKKSWGIIVFVFIGYFVKSCIEQFAQHRAAQLDQQEIESLLQTKKEK